MGIFQGIRDYNKASREYDELFDAAISGMKKVIESIKDNKMKLRDLKVGDVFQLHKGVFKVYELETNSHHVKTIGLLSWYNHGSNTTDGYYYFHSSNEVEKLDQFGDLVPLSLLTPGDRIAPSNFPNDVMTVTRWVKGVMWAQPDMHVKGYNGSGVEVDFKTFNSSYRFHLYRKHRKITCGEDRGENSKYAGDEYATVKFDHPCFEPGDDAYISTRHGIDCLFIMSDGEVRYTCLQTYLSDIHKLNLMSEEEFKAKHDKLTYAGQEVVNKGTYIKVGCETMHKGNIRGFMAVMKALWYYDERGYQADANGAYAFLVTNEKNLSL